jgi:Ricin-type beta-trefoil lectin domain
MAMKQTSFSLHPALRIAVSFAILATGCSSGAGTSSDTSTQPLSSGATGTIVDYTGLCLDTQGESGADGSWIQLATCNGAISQQWTFQNGQFVGLGGKCLDVFGGNYPDGTKVDLWDCNGGDNQQWSLQNGQFVGVGGRCLDVDAFQSIVGQTMQIWDCNGGQNQQFVFPGTASGGGGSSGSGSSGGGGSSNGSSGGSGSGSPATFVQSHWNAIGNTSTSTLSNTIPNVAAGDLLLVWMDWDYGTEMGGQRTFEWITDDAGNTYTQLDSEHGYLGPDNGYDTTRMYYAVNGTSGDRTITFQVNPVNGTFIGSFVAEYTSEDPNDPIDAVTWTLYADSQYATNPTANITTSSANDTVIGILGGGGLQSPTSGNGFSLRYQGDGNMFPFGLEDAVIATPGAVTVTWEDSQVQGYGLWDVAIHPAP